jgi:5-methylcytosine-specific restriction endonuclease McrA
MICPECGTEFELRRWSAKYCSPKCQKDHGRPKGERKKAMDAAYRATHKEEHKKNAAAWYDKNKELTKARASKWQKDNPERYDDVRRASRKKHKDTINARVRLHLKAHPELLRKKKIKTAQWKKEHPENLRATENKRRTAKTQAGGSFTPEEFIFLCTAYGFKCLCCNRKRKLTADHVIPVSKGGTSNIDNIQPLCRPCNSSKGAKCTDYR